MTMIYRVSSQEQLHHSCPLHVGRFYPNVERRHHRLMRDRQDLILYLAKIHSSAITAARCWPNGFAQVRMRLMTLRDWVYDYKIAFDHFFEVIQAGYHVGERHEISLVIPRNLPAQVPLKLVYVPPPEPRSGVRSKVFIRQHAREEILTRLAGSGRFDLQAPVEWLLSRDQLDFCFARAGRLQQRDTSTWPVQAIETWPAWLREALFGPGIDIEAAYTQFLLEKLWETYAGREAALQLLYPDLLRSLEDKQAWRGELCDLLQLPRDDDGISIVKRLIMSLANGSRISPAILLSNMGHSVTRDLVLEVSGAAPSELCQIGERLSQIARQYKDAKKAICTLKHSKANQKQVFRSYFEWEREARYAIWEAVGRHGIMVHDGIDGIPESYLADLPGLIRTLDLRLTRS